MVNEFDFGDSKLSSIKRSKALNSRFGACVTAVGLLVMLFFGFAYVPIRDDMVFRERMAKFKEIDDELDRKIISVENDKYLSSIEKNLQKIHCHEQFTKKSDDLMEEFKSRNTAITIRIFSDKISGMIAGGSLMILGAVFWATVTIRKSN